MAKRRGKILLGAGFFILGGLLFLAVLPLWLPLALRPGAARAGAHFKTYEARGYDRFVVKDVVFTNQTMTIQAGRAELYQPISWLWFARVSTRKHPPSFARVEDWRMSFSTRTNAPPRAKPLSSYDQVRTVERVIRELRQWLPAATATNGTIQIGPTTLNIRYAAWDRGRFQGAVEFPRWKQSATVVAQLVSGDHHKIEIISDSLKLRSEITTVYEAGGVSVWSTNSWWSNRFEARAFFASGGVLPEKGQLRAGHATVAAGLLGLNNYQDVTGDVQANWETGRFDLKVAGSAQPKLEATNLPPLEVELTAAGDTIAATVSSLNVRSPGLTAVLSQPLTLHFRGPLLTQEATMRVSADLAAQSMIPAHGTLEGEANFIPEPDRFPLVHFRVTGKGLGLPTFDTQAVRTEGTLNWPQLLITNTAVTFEDGSVALVSGEMDLRTRMVKGGAVQAAGTPGCKYLPREYTYESATILGSFDGIITNLSHQGHVALTNVQVPGFPRIQLQGDWNGRLLAFDRVALSLRTTNLSLSLTGACAINANASSLSLSTLRLSTNGIEVLQLSAPVSASFSVLPGRTNGWRARLEELRLAGSMGELQASASVDWPLQGTGRIKAQGWSTESFKNYIPPGPGTLILENLEAQGGWSNGPAQFQIALAMKGEADDRFARQIAAFQPQSRNGDVTNTQSSLRVPTSFQAKLLAGGDARGIVISNFTVNSETSAVVTVNGTLPIRIVPANRTNRFQIREDQPIQFSAVTQPQALLWEQLSAWAGVSLIEPDLQLQVSGTWANPLGAGKLSARKIRFPKGKTITPSFEDLNVRVELDQKSARLVEGSLSIQRQPVIITGELPLGTHFWEGFRRNHSPDLRQASGHLLLRKAELAALAELYPTLLSPQGEVNADIELLPGQKLRGVFTLAKGRTRPFPGVGPVRDITVSLKLSEKEVVLESASAYVGGAEVVLSGKTEVPDLKRLGQEWPPFEFKLRGTNVPLSRQPESIIRSDLDLSLIKTNGGQPIITGVTRLRDSFYLSDVTALVPSRVASPSRRPPYFSVETPELANWRIAVNVTGEKALRVRSTLFNGQASAHLRILGTLENPLAIGDLQLDSGSVKFPFGVLDIQQGFVTLGGGDPYRPQLAITAQTKQFGYDIRMEVTGPADQPVIQFTSTPPLSSEQIVLMITAGQVPNSALNISPQQRAQTVALFLGKDLLAKLGFSDDSEQRLTFHSGEQISEQGRPTYSLEYKLTKRWSLEGENDRFNAYNAGLKWHVYSK